MEGLGLVRVGDRLVLSTRRLSKISPTFSERGRDRRCPGRAARRASHRLAPLLLAAVLVAAGLPVATTATARDDDASSAAAASQSSDGGARITVSVSYTQAGPGGTGGGGPVTTSTQVEATVLPVCEYVQGYTGEEMAEFLSSSRNMAMAAHYSGESVEEIQSDYPDWEEYSEDTEGHWYTSFCWQNRAPEMDGTAFNEMKEEFEGDSPPVYVEAGEAPPEPPVDGATLAAAAWDAVEIPVPEVDHNPSLGGQGATLVGWYTWVWAAGDTPTQVTATATAGPVSATVTATATGLDLSAPDAQVDCHGFGTPWNQGAEGTDCTVVFTRSSAHLGGTTPLTTSIRYEVSYTATDGATGTLDTVTTTSTTALPVAEVQTLTTNPD